MAASGVHSCKQMRRLESRKSHSWWWDSHISPKNSKWLFENLEGHGLLDCQVYDLVA
ncbi:hypothetical protein JHK84_041052 [Glycine max]|nr:hypothetical protein JHK85_041445 [Glycine max]KAG5122712.1 hypothetical protein JHK84_041052 [Glycine max]